MKGKSRKILLRSAVLFSILSVSAIGLLENANAEFIADRIFEEKAASQCRTQLEDCTTNGHKGVCNGSSGSGTCICAYGTAIQWGDSPDCATS